MHRIAAFAVACATPFTLAASEAPTERVRELTAFADAFDAAQIAEDGAALQRMIADDLVFIDGDGKRSGKVEFIAGWTGAGDSYDPITLHDRIVMPLGDGAGLASAETVLSGRSEGKPFRVRIRFTDIFRRSANGGWQAAYIHVTRMPVESGG